MNDRFAFHCPSCNVKLHVSKTYLGRSCNCPKCGAGVTVELPRPDDENPLLVTDDGHRTPRRFTGWY
jgi:hypothetical protein